MCYQRTDLTRQVSMDMRPSRAPLERKVSHAFLFAGSSLYRPHQLIDKRMA